MLKSPVQEPLVSVEVVQALFECLTPMSEALRARGKALGFDPAMLEPTYSAARFTELVMAGARERYPALRTDEALEVLGRENVRAMQARNRWLAAMLPMMWLFGPHRVLGKANARRIGQQNTELLYTRLGPTEGELVIRPCPLPAFQAGVLAQVVENTGVEQVRVEVASSSAREAVFRVQWAAKDGAISG